jgi:DNA-directed RNA polymerase specialized sigma24 family protein
MTTGALYSERGRELLSKRILKILESWPEPYRMVFVRSHYWGDTAEMISASLDLTPAEVSQMLERCDQKLLSALRPFREENGSRGLADSQRLGAPQHSLFC